MMSAFMDELSFSEDEMAFEAIKDVGPGGHFFGTQHTLDRYETAFYPPILSEWNNFGQWTEDGGFDTTQRANRIWKQALADYQQPILDESKVEELEAFVAKRKENPGISMH